MRPERREPYPEIDEYLWPLTGTPTAVNWELLAEELRIRNRLAAIRAHVQEMHVQPRLKRAGRASTDVIQGLTASLIAGPLDGPPWMQRLKDPIPRALRDEWQELTQRLRAIEGRRTR